MIVDTTETVTLVGAGAVNSGEIKRCLSLASRLVAADGGAAHCIAAGLVPSDVIGDMDSLEPLEALTDATLHHVPEQDTTDFDKCLRNISAPLVLGAGFTGGRLDHQLACLNVMTRHAHRRCLLLGAEDIAFLAPPHLTLSLAPKTRVSLFPLGLVEGTSHGLRWPIKGLSFAPDGQIGTSNEATGPIELTFTAPKMLIMLPKSELENVTRTLLETRSGWPAL